MFPGVAIQDMILDYQYKSIGSFRKSLFNYGKIQQYSFDVALDEIKDQEWHS